ncbi:Uncharacterized HTH-type transcriptional regulator Rv1985c/MT2039 [Dermatophilus congolensis]|uniref:Uncharacterized HTH-type transcriptional regulator Rv1985c/MT2039 n=1 Tax=Dermatophilus congolensis TaxID=1863 RepID=A0AA46BLK0_9MICO|nr:LysR family transcriptional regulator ArgP [Dermatophilus congolensis]STD04606.1 Uncharacterized HTH-type transcriptional regulator Rv1985c/MT2039 [Dermatophilus congolensis]
MRLDLDRLNTLIAILEEGAFDAAAHTLGITPSAVSQRIRALESDVGHILIIRSTPCTATPAGHVLVRLARQMRLLEAEALATLHEDTGKPTELSLAVNADSLATWLIPAMHDIVHLDILLHLTIANEEVTSELLRTGDALGAVTSDPTPVQGCSTTPLGAMRYIPVATPTIVERHTTRNGFDWNSAPSIRYDADDRLQIRVIESQGITPTTRHHAHVIPSAEGFAAAIRAGLGWGVLPAALLDDDIERGHLIQLPAHNQDVPLYWQRRRITSGILDSIGAILERTAAQHLIPLTATTPLSGSQGRLPPLSPSGS